MHRLIVSLLLFFFTGSLPAQEKVNFGSETKGLEADTIISALSLEQKVGQVFIFGFSGQALRGQLSSTLEKYHPGAIIIFKRNIQSAHQIARLNHEAQQLSLRSSRLPLFIMVDQEGGSVTRIKSKPNPPSALSLGKTGDSSLVEEAGDVTGEILSQLGFTMNLAPVVDLASPNSQSFIGTRSYSEDPESVKNFAEAYALGLTRHEILPTLKHFPGHGGPVADSHTSLPQKRASLKDLMGHDLKPFEHFSKLKFNSGVMVAHIAYPLVDRSLLPATFSRVLVSDLLKRDLGFSGLVITDDIEMAGADSAGHIGERAVRAFEAGNDMIMVAWSEARQRKAFSALLDAVRSGRISENRLMESLRKIVLMKTDFETRLSQLPPEEGSVRQVMTDYSERTRLLSDKVAIANMKRALKDKQELRGFLNPKDPVFVFSADEKFYSEFIAMGGLESTFVRLQKGSPSPVPGRLGKQRKALGVYYATGAGSARQLNALAPEFRKRLLVINTTNPGVIEYPSDFLAVFNIYSDNFSAGAWLANYIYKGIEPEFPERIPAKESKAPRTKAERVSHWLRPPENPH